jgi:hypothetical protein
MSDMWFVLGDGRPVFDRESAAPVARAGPVSISRNPLGGPILARKAGFCRTCHHGIAQGAVITMGNKALGWRHSACTEKELA